MQNDALRFCYNIRLSDRIVDLHTRAKLSSLEQRRIRQLLGLQFLLYKEDTDRHVICANTRSQQKYVLRLIIKLVESMNDHHTIWVHVYGINYRKLYRNRKMFMYLKRK